MSQLIHPEVAVIVTITSPSPSTLPTLPQVNNPLAVQANISPATGMGANAQVVDCNDKVTACTNPGPVPSGGNVTLNFPALGTGYYLLTVQGVVMATGATTSTTIPLQILS
jgi:hypothetical protein